MSALAVLLGMPGASGAQAAPRGGASCETVQTTDRISFVNERGEIGLASGRLAKLSGIRLADEGPERDRAVAWLKEAAGREVKVDAFGTGVDRWGRIAATLVLESDAGPIDLTRNLIAAGFALADAGEANTLCRTDLLPIEARAREAGLGLWSGDRYKPLSADDPERLTSRIGQFTLIEGRIRSVGERRRRTYLNFGRDWTTDLTITIPQRTWDTLRSRSLTATALRGRRIRVRGIVEEWQGPAITLGAAELLEFLDPSPAQRR
jgi:endonuclease YncB( thermonuclease family)